MGVTNPTDGFNVTMINGGTFNIGGPPLPITLAWFEASFEAEDNGVRIAWQTLSEIDNYGFYVQRRPASSEQFQEIGFVPSQGNGIQPQLYGYLDQEVPAGDWHYRLRQVDLTGESTVFEHVTVNVPLVTGVGESVAPSEFALNQNYPNPFNPSATIEFALPQAVFVTLKVYNVLGEEVATLVDGVEETGYRSIEFDASTLASGVYIYRLTAGSFVKTMKMILVR
jgi:hypothetical protein